MRRGVNIPAGVEVNFGVLYFVGKGRRMLRSRLGRMLRSRLGRFNIYPKMVGTRTV